MPASKVKPIPEGYSCLCPYITVRNAAKAMDFYTQVFGAKEKFRIDHNGAIAHAEIFLGDSILMLADESPEMNAWAPDGKRPPPVSLMLYVSDVDQVASRAQQAGATMLRPLENKFYGDRACMIMDPFGHTWHLATHIEDVSEEEIRKRIANLFGGKMQ